MWRRYAASGVGFVVGVVLACLLGYADDGNVIAVAGFSIAAAVMTFGERWGLVPSSEDANKPQTLMLNDRDKPPARDVSGYMDSLDLKDDFGSKWWERFGALTFDRGRKKKKKCRARSE